MAELIRVLVVDDHPIVRRGIAGVLIPRNGMQVIGEAEDGEEAIVRARQLHPDVILMDLNMPKLGGLEAIRAIHAEDPAARILVLTSFDEDGRVSAAIKAGALVSYARTLRRMTSSMPFAIRRRGSRFCPRRSCTNLSMTFGIPSPQPRPEPN